MFDLQRVPVNRRSCYCLAIAIATAPAAAAATAAAAEPTALAAAATTTAAEAAASTAKTTAVAAAITGAKTTFTRFTWASSINPNLAILERSPIHLQGLLCAWRVLHFHKTEALALASLAVTNDFRRLNFPSAAKQLRKVVVRHGIGKVPNIQPGTHQITHLCPQARKLDSNYTSGIDAFSALTELELNTLTRLKRAEAIRLDGGVVHKNVFTVILEDESVPLGTVKPLDRSDHALFH